MHENTYSLRIQHPINPPYRDHYVSLSTPALRHLEIFRPRQNESTEFLTKKNPQISLTKIRRIFSFFCPAQETTLQWGKCFLFDTSVQIVRFVYEVLSILF